MRELKRALSELFSIKKVVHGIEEATMSSRIKTVVVFSTDPWLDKLHGASILGLFKALTKFRCKVKVLLPSTSNKIMEDGLLSVMGLEVKKHIPLFTLISLYKRVFRLLLKEKSSVLIFDFPMLPLFLFFKVLWKSKGIMLILSRPVGEQGFLKRLRFLHFRLSLIIGRLFVNAFTAISPFEAIEFSKLGKISRVFIIPSPLGEGFMKFNYRDNVEELRRKLGLDMLVGKKVLLYHGILDENRGILKVIKLFADTFKGNNQITLLLIGDGPAKELIKTFIETNVINNIILRGPIPYSDVPSIITACDVGLVILPDSIEWRYQCPTKLLEFLSLGKPVIASDLPGIRWAASGSSNVIFMKKIDPSTFAHAVKQALVSDNRSVENTKTKIQKRFGVNQIALKLYRIINEID